MAREIRMPRAMKVPWIFKLNPMSDQIEMMQNIIEYKGVGSQ
jgi:hypothetical protein